MKLSKVIAELQNIEKSFGDIECVIQDNPKDSNYPDICKHEHFFIVPEDIHESDSGKTEVVFRVWPY